MRQMVYDSISAISENDLELANKVIATDDEVDNYFAEMRQHLTTVMQQKPQYVPQYVDYLMIAKYVERIADHSTNIAQWVMFVVKNELKNWALNANHGLRSNAGVFALFQQLS